MTSQSTAAKLERTLCICFKSGHQSEMAFFWGVKVLSSRVLFLHVCQKCEGYDKRFAYFFESGTKAPFSKRESHSLSNVHLSLAEDESFDG